MLIFLYGEDSFRSRNKLNELKEKFLREIDPQGNSLSTIDGSMANFSQINESISPSSLFASKRMVVIENIFANSKKTILDEILNYLKILKSDENIVIFWDEISGEKMSKNKFFNLSNPQIVDWIKKQVEQENVNITNAVAAEMVAMFGANLRQISNELKKIINFKKGNSGEQGAAIQKEDILLMSRGNFNENIFALTDAISQKNKALALSLFEQELEGGTADTYLVHMITRQIKILLQIKEALEQGLTPRKIINKLKFHPFVVQKTSVQAKNFTLAKLKNILSLLVYIDQKIKTGKVDAKTGLELLIVKI